MGNPFERGPEKEPVEKRCPECGGTGKKEQKTCGRCGGKGWILTQKW